jgi:hypothetical protein
MLTYRLRQFASALQARITPAERTLVAQLLTPAEQDLFQRMPVYDQRHCLDVYHTLVAAGHCDPLLLRAALIHDCGKVDDAGHPMTLAWYVLVTILKRLPLIYTIAGSGHLPLLQPVQTYAEHAWRGARMAAAAGSPQEMVLMLRHYHDPLPHGLARILQWADERN